MKEAVSSPATASCAGKLFVIGGGPDDYNCSDKVSLEQWLQTHFVTLTYNEESGVSDMGQWVPKMPGVFCSNTSAQTRLKEYDNIESCTFFHSFN